MKMNQMYGVILLRISISLVFLWFGINQLYAPSAWISFVPSFLTSFAAPKLFVLLNGCFEVIFGMLLLSGFYVRGVSLILGLHLIGISFSLGYSAIAVRDFGLSMATISLLFFEEDQFCLEKVADETKDLK
jgi:uncharacterized membrane protein YphA (DoxX/SURF4 family)